MLTVFIFTSRMADDVLLAGVKSVTDLMVRPGLINLDFADVQTVCRWAYLARVLCVLRNVVVVR